MLLPQNNVKGIMLMTAHIDNQIIEAIVTLLDMDDAGAITPETRIEDDLGLDSGLLLELFMALEERLPNLQIDPSELRPDQFATVGALSALIASFDKEGATA